MPTGRFWGLDVAAGQTKAMISTAMTSEAATPYATAMPHFVRGRKVSDMRTPKENECSV